MCPQAKVLGLGVPNGAPVCAAAQELFADCIVSHMTVAEAMAAGTMPVPSAYAALLWPQEEELATLRARIKNLCMPKGDTSLRVQYEELSWSLRQVENLTVLLPRLLSDTSGHYLVLFGGKSPRREKPQNKGGPPPKRGRSESKDTLTGR